MLPSQTDSDLADLTRTKEQVLTQDVALRLAQAEVVLAEVAAVDAPLNAPLLQKDLALKEKLLIALAIAKLRQAHPQAQVALVAASEAALAAAASVADSEALAAASVVSEA